MPLVLLVPLMLTVSHGPIPSVTRVLVVEVVLPQRVPKSLLALLLSLSVKIQDFTTQLVLGVLLTLIVTSTLPLLFALALVLALQWDAPLPQNVLPPLHYVPTLGSCQPHAPVVHRITIVSAGLVLVVLSAQLQA
jgi:hypothetical protein